jgi:hypothetical protein
LLILQTISGKQNDADAHNYPRSQRTLAGEPSSSVREVGSGTTAGATRMSRSPHHKMNLAIYMFLFMTQYTTRCLAGQTHFKTSPIAG